MKKNAPHPTNPSSFSERDYALLAAFRNALRDFVHFSEEAALAAGLAPQQHQAMLAIRGIGSDRRLTIGDLAARMKVKHHSAVGLVKRMEAAGLVTKSHDPENHRQVLVELTSRGRRLLEDLSPVHKSELARIGPALRKILKQLETPA